MRNLAWLLNTTCLFTNRYTEFMLSYAHASNLVVNYGIPYISRVSLTDLGLPRFAANIR